VQTEIDAVVDKARSQSEMNWLGREMQERKERNALV